MLPIVHYDDKDKGARLPLKYVTICIRGLNFAHFNYGWLLTSTSVLVVVPISVVGSREGLGR